MLPCGVQDTWWGTSSTVDLALSIQRRCVEKERTVMSVHVFWGLPMSTRIFGLGAI